MLEDMMEFSSHLFLQEFRHVHRRDKDGFEILEEFFLAAPENSIVSIRRLTCILDLRMKLPTWTVINPLASIKLTLSPRIAHLDHINCSAPSIIDTTQYAIRMAIDDAISLLRIRPLLCATSHYEVIIIPCAHALEHCIFINL